MQRWAVSVGSGLPSAPWDESRKSTLDPLDDDTAIVVDQIICHAPTMTRKLLREWYCGCGSASVVGRKIGVSRHTAYVLISEALGFLSRQFLRSGHAGLMGLLKLERVP